ncbi:MAG: 1-acyl-sn-glycerol-3-phosphate acyltransferase [Bacteroidaceae bacterium]|nr:1-acyl-sn-glycerol-3-phosphate acyltransferase [Bacteroidaceae bacterium]MBQ8009613.1 1-acyl-sn-glycerol-3-phosphate acyltransferase [Bacteroidaceae bacterium]MBR1541721.1 1-acyl-sn-glycerol-3-phosphate acyltransferase [Bacteroidaceae bacterium]
MATEFDEIRPYLDEELPQIYEELIADPAFVKIVSGVLPFPFEVIAERMRACKTKLEFQKTFCYRFLRGLADSTTKGVTSNLDALPNPDRAYTYISNHRDIILDSGFLSVLLVENGLDTVEIAIGDNLLIYPWIKKLVRINKSFIVQRALTMRQMLESSARMSRYMHYTINQKNQSIWIAQREGRAKDSNDRTQDSVLKMVAMGGEGDFLDRLIEMNIVPLSISYEYDPCDYLKAQEYQLKRDILDYKKTTADDLKNMETGMFGFKGRVHFQIAPCINDQLKQLDRSLPKQELFSCISAIIDRGIHSNYRFYPNNYVAHDWLTGETRFADKYTPEEKDSFEAYIFQQIAKIEIDDKDEDYLRHMLLLMYANPLTNYLKIR